MTEPGTELCLACGLCCDGSLFGLVPLRDAEVAVARRHGLVLLHDRMLVQPCGALGSGARRPCAIHAERPASCRAFECRLLAAERSDPSASAGRFATVARARALLATVTAGGAPESVIDELRELVDREFSRA